MQYQSLANDAFLEFIRTPQWIISPFKQSFSNFNYTKTKKRENNRLKNYKENRYLGSIKQLKPYDGFNIPKFKFETYKNNLIDKKETTYQKFTSSITKFYKFDTGFSYNPNINHLNRLTFNSSISQSKSNLNNTLTLKVEQKYIIQIYLKTIKRIALI